jgi:hypothetical protein
MYNTNISGEKKKKGRRKPKGRSRRVKLGR